MIKLANNCFIAGPEGTELVPLTEPIILPLLMATGSKLLHHKLKLVGGNTNAETDVVSPKFCIAMQNLEDGGVQFLHIPASEVHGWSERITEQSDNIKWIDNQCYIKFSPVMNMTVSEFDQYKVKA